MVIIGIDPGNSGSVAITNTSKSTVHTFNLDKSDHDLIEIFKNELNYFLDGMDTDLAKCYLENVHAFPKQGVTSVWTFAENYGKLKMILAFLQIPYELVTPMKWQKRLSIPVKPKDCDKSYHKNVLKAKAQQLFPSQNITLKNADALLIMEYGRRCEMFNNNGETKWENPNQVENVSFADVL